MGIFIHVKGLFWYHFQKNEENPDLNFFLSSYSWTPISCFKSF